MQVKQMTSIEELISIMPLMKELHAKEQEYYKYFTPYGYTTWLVTAFLNGHAKIWYCEDADGVQGYMLAELIVRFMQPECVIHDAYMRKPSKKVSNEAYAKAMQWAKDSGCKLVSCCTTRDNAMTRKWGFKYVTTYMVKPLEG